jgi:TetR/AcrR family transcriptional regulator, ethionamide resistance regulator
MSTAEMSIQAHAGRQRREATQGDLLDATARLLAVGTPITALSVDRIVAEAGVARRTFYLHFKDKKELITRLATDQIAWREEVGAEVLSDPDLTRGRLDQLLIDITARWMEHRTVLAAMIAMSEYDEEVRSVWESALRAIATNVTEHLTRRWAGRRDGPADIDSVSRVLVWMLERSCHQITRQPERQDDITTAMSEICWRLLELR